MSNCCVQSVPPDSNYETLDQPVLDWVARLTAGPLPLTRALCRRYWRRAPDA